MQNRQLLKLGAEKLAQAGITSPSLEARILLAQACEENQEYLLLNFDQQVSEVISNKYFLYIERRIQKEPIAYITGLKEFYGRDFIINSDVLIPRAETEILIDAVLENNNASDEVNILELGSGSGIIAITLALEWSAANIMAVDISEKALACAEQNITKYKVGEQVRLVHSNWFASLDNNKYDIIISNPPYISKSELDVMADETKQYEPSIALFADNEGLECYEDILKGAKEYLHNSGSIYLEIGYKQHQQITALAQHYDFHVDNIYKDLQGHIRTVQLKNKL